MTTLAELKKAILNKKIDDNLLVFCYKDVSFIAHQYAHAIADIKNLNLSVEEDFDAKFLDFQNSMFDFSDIDCLRLFEVDKFSTKLTKELSNIKNTIVICKDVDDKTLKQLKELEMYFEFDKMQEWQIIDYMKAVCKGLNESKIKWLCSIANKDIYRLDNEMKKISCFEIEKQDDVFDMIDLDNGYSDLTELKIFDLSNAICARDYKEVDRILKEIDNLNVEAMSLIAILKRQFKLIVQIQLNSTVTAESLNIKSVQFNIIRNKNCNKFTSDKLKSIYEFLNDFDYKLKSGLLDINKNSLIDYILCEILS